jgi:hypothetical protein
MKGKRHTTEDNVRILRKANQGGKTFVMLFSIGFLMSSKSYVANDEVKNLSDSASPATTSFQGAI